MNYLDPNDWRTAQIADTMQATANMVQDLTLITALKAELTVKDGVYTYSYGRVTKDIAGGRTITLGSGVTGTGESAWKAMLDFNHNFYNHKTT